MGDHVRGRLIWAVAVTSAMLACGGDFSTSDSPGDGDVSGDGDAGGDGDGDLVEPGDGDVGDGDVGDGDASGGDSGTGGGPPGGGPGTGGMGPVTNLCPLNPPSLSMKCPPGLTCTYGDDPRMGCRETYSCPDGSAWQVASPDCKEPPSCLGNGPAVANGLACDTLGDTCFYGPTSPTCVCVECLSSDCADGGEYVCVLESDPCPTVPPNIGQPCGDMNGSLNGTVCEYARCPSPFHVVMQCVDGGWASADVVCAE